MLIVIIIIGIQKGVKSAMKLARHSKAVVILIAMNVALDTYKLNHIAMVLFIAQLVAKDARIARK